MSSSNNNELYCVNIHICSDQLWPMHICRLHYSAVRLAPVRDNHNGSFCFCFNRICLCRLPLILFNAKHTNIVYIYRIFQFCIKSEMNELYIVYMRTMVSSGSGFVGMTSFQKYRCFFCFLLFHFCFCYCQFCVWCLCLCALLKRFVYAGAQCVCVYWAHVNEYDTRIYWMWINKFTRMRKCRTMTIEIFGIVMRAVALVMEGLANSPITSSTSLHVLASDQSIISLIRNVFSFFFVPAKWNFSSHF